MRIICAKWASREEGICNEKLNIIVIITTKKKLKKFKKIEAENRDLLHSHFFFLNFDFGI